MKTFKDENFHLPAYYPSKNFEAYTFAKVSKSDGQVQHISKEEIKSLHKPRLLPVWVWLVFVFSMGSFAAGSIFLKKYFNQSKRQKISFKLK